MTLITGNGLWDAAGTAMIGVLLVIIAVVLALETKSLLLHAHHSLKTLHLGPEELLVAATISVCEGETGEQIAEAINAAEQRIRSAVPIARIIYLEPDVYAPRTEQVPADSSGPASH